MSQLPKFSTTCCTNEGRGLQQILTGIAPETDLKGNLYMCARRYPIRERLYLTLQEAKKSTKKTPGTRSPIKNKCPLDK